MLTRLIDYLKMQQITAVFTDLTHAGQPWKRTNEEISSLIDTWILLRDIELNGERNRGLYILKSRGMAHSNQIREFLMSDQRHRAGGCLPGNRGRADRQRARRPGNPRKEFCPGPPK